MPSQRGGGVAHAAHLGGMLAGLAWVKLGWHRDFVQLPWEGWFSGRRFRPQKDPAKSSAKTSRWSRSNSEPPAEVPSEEFISREVDPILDKISKHGIQSLTDEERRVLEAARNRMAKR